MGLIGWASRRVLASIIFGPLLAMWYVILVVVTRANPPPIERIALGAILLALVSDGMIIRRVKRAMKAPKQQPPR